MQKDGKTLSIIGLVFGIVSIVLSFVYLWNILGLVLGIVGIVLAAKGKKEAVAAGVPAGIGTAGLVLAIIGTVLSFIGFFTCTLCVLCVAGAVNEAVGSDIDLNAILSAASALN